MGISTTQGAHQVAHRFSRTGVPPSWARSSAIPCVSVTTLAGISLPAWLRSSSPVKVSVSADALSSCCAVSPLSLSHPPSRRAVASVSGNSKERDISGSNQMWGGRFAEGPAAIMREINASIPFDKALWRQDIAASRAHAAMLGACGVISSEDAEAIDRGLAQVADEYERDGVPEDW